MNAPPTLLALAALVITGALVLPGCGGDEPVKPAPKPVVAAAPTR